MSEAALYHRTRGPRASLPRTNPGCLPIFCHYCASVWGIHGGHDGINEVLPLRKAVEVFSQPSRSVTKLSRKGICCGHGGFVRTLLSLQGYLTQKETPPLGPYRRPMPRVLGGSWEGGRFLMGEVPLYLDP
jgi:hypothetical protein